MTERPSFDLTAADLDTTRPIAPEGWHLVEIDDVEDDLETSNGNPQYLVKYKWVDETIFKGQLWDYIAVTKASIQNIVSLARAAGLDVPTKEKPGTFTLPDADDLIGKVIQIQIEHKDDYKGATDDDGNVIQRAGVRFAGRKKEGEKVGKVAAKATTKAGAKAPAKGKAAAAESGFSL